MLDEVNVELKFKYGDIMFSKKNFERIICKFIIYISIKFFMLWKECWGFIGKVFVLYLSFFKIILFIYVLLNKKINYIKYFIFIYCELLKVLNIF